MTRRVSSPAAAIPRLPFDQRAPIDGFEILRLEELRARIQRRSHTRRVHRAAFHSISFTTGGRTVRSVDFVAYDCVPGTLLWVRPGQVQQYAADDTTEGWHIIFTADFVAALSRLHPLLDDWAPTLCRLVTAGDPLDEVRTFCALLAREQEAATSAAGIDVVRMTLGALLSTIGRDAPPVSTAASGNETYARFRALLERRYRSDRSVTSYARLLGYSSRTLTRACVLATGRPAKDLIDERVTLEARRLLAHSNDSVARIARTLGFDETTNFVKFFQRRSPLSPRAFRHALPDSHRAMT